MRTFFIVFLPGLAAIIAGLAVLLWVLWYCGRHLAIRVQVTREINRRHAVLTTQRDAQVREIQRAADEQGAQLEAARNVIDRLSAVAALTPGGIPPVLREAISKVTHDSRGVLISNDKAIS